MVNTIRSASSWEPVAHAQTFFELRHALGTCDEALRRSAWEARNVPYLVAQDGLSANKNRVRFYWKPEIDFQQHWHVHLWLVIRTFRSDDATATRTSKTTTTKIGLEGKTTILQVQNTFLYISLPFLYNYDVKLPNFALCGT